MPDSIKKLREPAALATVAFVGLGLIGLLIGLLFPPDSDGGFGSFSDRSYTASGLFLSFDFAIALAIAVYLANHAAGAPLAKARLITLIALVEAAVAIVFGVITMLAAFGADGVGGSAKFGNFLGSLGSLAVLAVAAWYVWLSWQQHAPAKTPAAAQSPAWSGGYPSQPQYGQPQPGQYPGQQAGQYPGQPQHPGQSGEQAQQPPQQQSGPFSVGDWRSDS